MCNGALCARAQGLSEWRLSSPFALFCDAVFEEWQQRSIRIQLDDLSDESFVSPHTGSTAAGQCWRQPHLVKVCAAEEKQVDDALSNNPLAAWLLCQEPKFIYHSRICCRSVGGRKKSSKNKKSYVFQTDQILKRRFKGEGQPDADLVQCL